ncbi:hypothetical protein D8674_000218 [Pyrus ussuriensis x Pyrus communis]|uniref:Uncharacterized protein n=1 Tax=Pyrus ussuriensis x Pyrus communis TaxID=2448454 RepID=A0A5N5F2H7_9ROSA|nr:hypothetical protein D8674_000218 [Pyrus ussuriensis x Pyrus communis]
MFASCFGHLESVDRLAFNRQLVHILSFRRVANQRVKDLEGLTYLIGCEVTGFMKKDFCFIMGLRCDEPYDLEVEPSNIRLLTKYFSQKFGFVGESSKGKGNGDDADIVMLETLTPDTNDVRELKVQMKELKVVVGCLTQKKDIFQRNVFKKVEELTEEVKELMKEVKKEEKEKCVE